MSVRRAPLGVGVEVAVELDFAEHEVDVVRVAEPDVAVRPEVRVVNGRPRPLVEGGVVHRRVVDRVPRGAVVAAFEDERILAEAAGENSSVRGWILLMPGHRGFVGASFQLAQNRQVDNLPQM